jgi:hypothetical protein
VARRRRPPISLASRGERVSSSRRRGRFGKRIDGAGVFFCEMRTSSHRAARLKSGGICLKFANLHREPGLHAIHCRGNNTTASSEGGWFCNIRTVGSIILRF